MQLLLVSLAVLQIYSWPRGGANAGPVEKEACPGGNCDSSYSFNNDDVLIRKQRYAMSGRGGPGGGRPDSEREDESDGVQIETLEWDEGDNGGPHFHGQSDIYKSVLLQTDPEDGQPVQKSPLAGGDEPADEKPAVEDLDEFKARSAPMAEDKAASEDSTTDKDRDSDDEEKTLKVEGSKDKESSQNKDIKPKKKKKKTGKRDHDDFSGLHFHRMSSLYKTVMTKGELEEEEEEVKGSEVAGQSNDEGQDDDLDVDDSENGNKIDKDEENGPEDMEGLADTNADENKDSVDKNEDDENGPEETEGPSDTTNDEDKDSINKKSFDGSEDKESFKNKDVEPKKKRRKRDTGKRDHDDFSGLHFHRMSSLYKTVMTKGELEEEEEEVKGSEVKGQSNDEVQDESNDEGPDDDIEKESTTTDEKKKEPDENECTDENCSGCPSCQNEKPETPEDQQEEAPEDGDNGEDGGGEKSSEEDEGGATNSEDDEVVKETDQKTSEEQLNGEENQNKDEHKTKPVEDDTPINVKDYISRVLVKFRDERLVHSHTDDP